MTTATYPWETAENVIKATAETMHEALNFANSDVLAWMSICSALASNFINSGFKIDRIEFLTACGFDEACGHYDWRSEWRNVGCGISYKVSPQDTK